MKKFTPEDLKKKYPQKYDNWKFVQKRNGDWYGVYKNEGGTITGNKSPTLDVHQIEITGEWSLGILRHLFKHKTTTY